MARAAMTTLLGMSVWTAGYCTVLGALALHLSFLALSRWRELRRRRVTRMTPAELKKRLDAGEDLAVLDFRHALDRLASPYGIPGALRFSPEKPQLAPKELRNRLVVFYCTGPNGAAKAAGILREHGISRPCYLTGGIPAWRQAHFPTEPLEDLSFRRAAAQGGSSVFRHQS